MVGHGGTFLWKNCDCLTYIKPKGNILAWLGQQIDSDIETLYKIIAQQERKRTICMTMSLQPEENPFEAAP